MKTVSYTIDDMSRQTLNALYYDVVINQLKETFHTMPIKWERQFMALEMRLTMKACKRATTTINGIKFVVTKSY